MKYLKRFNESLLDDIRNKTDKNLSDIHNKLGSGDKDHKFCGECGTKLNKSDTFCDECGEKQDEESMTAAAAGLSHLTPPKIEIENIDFPKDGGSLDIETNIGYIHLDLEIGTKTPYLLTMHSKTGHSQVLLSHYKEPFFKALKEYFKKKFPNSWTRTYNKYIDGINSQEKNFNIGLK